MLEVFLKVYTIPRSGPFEEYTSNSNTTNIFRINLPITGFLLFPSFALIHITG